MVGVSPDADDGTMTPERTHHVPPEVPSLPFDTRAGAALAVMSETDARCAVVTIDGAPFAVVVQSEVSEMNADIAVGRQVRWVVVDVAATTDERQTLEMFEGAAWRWMLRRGRPEVHRATT